MTNHNLFKYFLIALLAFMNKSFQEAPIHEIPDNSLSTVPSLLSTDQEDLLVKKLNKWDVGYSVESVEDFLEDAYYCIRVIHSLKVIGYVNKGDYQVFQYGNTCSPKSSYKVLRDQNSGQFKLLNQATNKFLTESGDLGIINPVKLSDYNDDNDRQIWDITHFANTQFQLFNAVSSHTLEVEFESKQDGIRLITNESNHENINQRFIFILNSNN